MTHNSDNQDTSTLLSEVRSIIGSIYQIIDFIGRSPFSITMGLFLVMWLPIPLISELFTELQIAVKVFVSIGVGMWSLIIREILSFGIVDIISNLINLYIVKISITCSICTAVYFAVFSVMIWWLALMFSTSLQQSLEQACAKICEITGGNKVWRVSNICSIPPILTMTFIGYWGIEGLNYLAAFAWLAMNWQTHELGITMQEWVDLAFPIDEWMLRTWYFIFIY